MVFVGKCVVRQAGRFCDAVDKKAEKDSASDAEETSFKINKNISRLF